MGKAARWLKGIFGMKREKGQHYEHSGSLGPSKNEKKATGKYEVSQSSTTSSSSVMASGHGWMGSFVADKEDEKIKHAIDVGIERLRSYDRGKLFCGSREVCAAVMIQSFFRGYLARKALKALRGLVKLQALVKGYLVRKRVAATLYSMQAMVRAQAVARSQRICHSTNKKNIFYRDTRSRKQMQLFDETRNELYGKRLPIYSKTLSMNGFEERAKVVEVDTHTPHSRSRSITSAKSECGENLQYQTMASPLHCVVPGRVSVHECRNPQDMEWHFSVNERIFSTSQNTPRFAGSMQPVKSVCGNTLFQHYSNFPNYMANTQSSKAKVRSHSAPKTRPPELKTRLSLNEIMAARNSISSVNQKYHYCFDKVV